MNFKSAFLLSAVFSASLLASGCGAMHHSAMGAGAAPTAARLGTADVAFASTAAGSGLYEVEISRVAAARASNPQVKAYAQMLVEHHTMSNNELMAIMRAKGVAPPPVLAPDKQAKLTQLSGTSGADLDRQYIRMVGIQDHQADIALFREASRSAIDPDLKAFATKTLPVLVSHLQEAQKIAAAMAG